ncbi:UDP-N-acetylmuramoyl-L-alanine--D-glutamate ligase [Algoriphagus halophytocola]|uniref:UDP-N-acetylmuramoylalanine--D-glutamate ligase n=1 Tax=Algoriphagus halophytocola TaxID=2991499 RepID=A0ABY6MDU2_9BACT|nr:MULTISPECIES: UDP-N-acetylmuramoyl-L-alanine--D-glutamate ligase [unclassified Algoriphagus]UZD21074.1 UDP-N-acetylmuramoyl-L-alanine--D-glutamate ligase [Algoriphagus sp. TR-M5]WBL42240.1 UDP-N-acetylmuramoyl-L-alanine--D-glutamate ligase [Algoriphagus sp. TR-M9]
MKRIAILGAGESGMGAAMLAKREGYAVFVSDAGKISAERKTLLEKSGIAYEEGGHSEERILDADLIVKSPGISPKSELLAKAARAEISIIDELEFAFGFSSGRVIAVTGTNGKTTTTLLTFHLMKEAGMDVGLAGNVGQSWAAQLCEADHEWWVIECSSFQIDGFVKFRPTFAILTNITPDHLDRYEYKIENYTASKFRLFNNMQAGDTAIFFAEDALSSEGMKKHALKAGKLMISAEEVQEHGAWTDGAHLTFAVADKSIRVPVESLSIQGKHNLLNSLFAGTAAMLAGVGEVELMLGFQTFKNAPHRMELIREVNGVRFVNDSKGTNVEATAYALASYENPLIWIAGGVDKGNDYTVLMPLVEERVKVMICLGRDNEKLKAAFGTRVKTIRETQDVKEAVSWGMEHAESGDVVLLSPACASFDLFKNYEDRGMQFRSAVENLKPKAIA